MIWLGFVVPTKHTLKYELGLIYSPFKKSEGNIFFDFFKKQVEHVLRHIITSKYNEAPYSINECRSLHEATSSVNVGWAGRYGCLS